MRRRRGFARIRGPCPHSRAILRRHPRSKLYVDFPDFGFFRLNPLRASLNGGFGRAYALTAEDLIISSPAVTALAEMESSAIEHMNIDHADAVKHYATVHCRASDGDWKVVGIDAAGLDLSDGERLKRLEFDAPIRDTAELRPLLKKLYR